VSADDGYRLLQQVAADAFRWRGFAVACRAYAELERLDPDPEYAAGALACVGALTSALCRALAEDGEGSAEAAEAADELADAAGLLRHPSASAEERDAADAVERWLDGLGGGAGRR